MAAPQIIVLPAIHLALIRMKPGTYGISYDIYTVKTEGNLPEGWDAPQGAQLLTNLKMTRSNLTNSCNISSAGSQPGTWPLLAVPVQ